MQVPSLKARLLERSPSHFSARPLNEANRSVDQAEHLRGDLHLKPNKRVDRPEQRAC